MLLLTASLVACGNLERVELSACWPRCDAGRGHGGEDAGAPELTWGQHALTLELPPCPASPNPMLWVDTAAHEVDAAPAPSDPAEAGPTLSLVEALIIAGQREGADIIRFDPGVFPVDAPGRIDINTAVQMPVSTGPVCVDGVGAGAVISWRLVQQEGRLCDEARCMLQLEGGSLLRGLELRDYDTAPRVGGTQVAGCQLGPASDTALAVDYLSEVGPHNFFIAELRGVVVWHADGTVVHGNDFGYDRIHGRAGPMWLPVLGFAPASFTDNVVLSSSFLIQQAGSPLTLSANHVCVDRDHSPLPGPCGGLNIIGSGAITVGPDNVLRGTGARIEIISGDELPVTVTRNSISGDGGGIVYVGAPPVAAPAVEGFDGAVARGTCPVAGTLELFADPAGLGELYLGSTACSAGPTWQISPAAAIPAGYGMTATLTASGQTSPFSAPLHLP